MNRNEKYHHCIKVNTGCTTSGLLKKKKIISRLTIRLLRLLYLKYPYLSGINLKTETTQQECQQVKSQLVLQQNYFLQHNFSQLLMLFCVNTWNECLQGQGEILRAWCWLPILVMRCSSYLQNIGPGATILN